MAGKASLNAAATFVRHPERRTSLVVPLHKELKRGTLRGILRDADLTADELLDNL